MDFNEYQDRAKETAIYPKDVGKQYTALGLAGEAGEYCNKLKKVFRDDGGLLTTISRELISSELGDVLWYVAACATELELSLDEIASHNIEKLALRQAADSLGGAGDSR